MSAAHIPPNWRIAETVRPGVRIGEMVLFTGTFPDEEGIAIANLIAAAPELLEALILMVRTHDEPAATLLQEMKEQKWLEKARAAITKATGEQA